jgi:hypothetical protein
MESARLTDVVDVRLGSFATSAITGWRGSYTPKTGHPVATQNPPCLAIFGD